MFQGVAVQDQRTHQRADTARLGKPRHQPAAVNTTGDGSVVQQLAFCATTVERNPLVPLVDDLFLNFKTVCEVAIKHVQRNGHAETRVIDSQMVEQR